MNFTASMKWLEGQQFKMSIGFPWLELHKLFLPYKKPPHFSVIVRETVALKHIYFCLISF